MVFFSACNYIVRHLLSICLYNRKFFAQISTVFCTTERKIALEEFELILGCRVSGCNGLESSYTITGDGSAVCCITAGKLRRLAEGALKLLKAPVFFFAELPCTETEEADLGGGLHKNIYYLDNCTKEVAEAIIKRYSDLLFSDGLLEWGFGSHPSESEVYFRKYQQVSFFGKDELPAFEKLMEQLSVRKTDNFRSLCDFISQERPAERFSVEADGETIYDMVENLTEAGLYKYCTSQDE